MVRIHLPLFSRWGFFPNKLLLLFPTGLPLRQMVRHGFLVPVFVGSNPTGAVSIKYGGMAVKKTKEELICEIIKEAEKIVKHGGGEIRFVPEYEENNSNKNNK